MITKRIAIVWDEATGPVVAFRSPNKAQRYCQLKLEQLERCHVSYVPIVTGKDADDYLN